MNVAEAVRDLQAKRAAQRQYQQAAERLGERSIRTLREGKPILAQGMAVYANRIALRAREELDCE